MKDCPSCKAKKCIVESIFGSVCPKCFYESK